MNIMERYQERCERQYRQLHEMYMKADQQGRSWSAQFDLEEQYLKKKHRLANVVWFNGLSYEEQIEIAARTKNQDFIRKLDNVQLAAYRIIL